MVRTTPRLAAAVMVAAVLALSAVAACDSPAPDSAPGADAVPNDAGGPAAADPFPPSSLERMPCYPATAASTFSFDGKPLTFNCSPGDGSERVLLGGVTVGADGWQVEEGIVYGANDMMQLATSELLPLIAIGIVGAECAFAGTGATMAFDGERVNYTCGPDDEGREVVLLGDLLGDPREPEVTRATLSGSPPAVSASEVVTVTYLLVGR